jgi:hypothetical protein
MNQRLLVLPHGISRHLLRSAKFKVSAVESLSVSKRGGQRMRFREEPVTPVYRHWICEQVGCNGELLSTGEGITRLSTRWKHRCGKCGHEDWADATYPRVAYLPIDAIGPDDSYTWKFGLETVAHTTIGGDGPLAIILWLLWFFA